MQIYVVRRHAAGSILGNSVGGGAIRNEFLHSMWGVIWNFGIENLFFNERTENYEIKPQQKILYKKQQQLYLYKSIWKTDFEINI